jgi:hypothetical protein
VFLVKETVQMVVVVVLLVESAATELTQWELYTQLAAVVVDGVLLVEVLVLLVVLRVVQVVKLLH